MKTIKDILLHDQGKEDLKEEAIKLIKEIKDKSKEHRKQLNKKGFLHKEEGYDPYSFELEGLTFMDWHESSDPIGAVMILKHFFNISEEDLV